MRIAMSETQVEERADEDPAFTFNKLLFLANDRTMPQEMKYNVVSEDVPPVPEDNDINKTFSYKSYDLENIKKSIHLMQEEGGSVA
ncbi:hypothetical protein G6F70_006154 [Rhizopus microsporus]|uniref:Uncharacterized protein n=1 Tax=Rhizopus azygosporus TaxID=86630 RepID=A0A367JUK7_RHIAZ|nr:hypothetical protein G6F71_002728 [Rhizopus microsporus]RCH93575.1 hypothetical protein CU097_001705 [Rhizopus azygosporus]KAG1198028.1 hypothetical protein G6F70_006154 [Rhizopus microsporus]KAG1209771.1 hypothetical protein G6F69_006066 [Rhizopus microsporus]KAG1231425.1 hypothetical protein G6F67_005762 [Rhizopus microsporus]